MIRFNLKRAFLTLNIVALVLGIGQFSVTNSSNAQSTAPQNITCSATLPDKITLTGDTNIKTPTITGDTQALKNYYLLVNYDVGKGYQTLVKIKAADLIKNSGKEISLKLNDVKNINGSIAKNGDNKLNISLILKSPDTQGVACGEATNATYQLTSTGQPTLTKQAQYSPFKKPLQGVLKCSVKQYITKANAGQQLSYDVTVTNLSKNDTAPANTYKIYAVRNFKDVDNNDSKYVINGVGLGVFDSKHPAYTKTIKTTIPKTYANEPTSGKTVVYTIEVRSSDQSYRIQCDSGVQTITIAQIATKDDMVKKCKDAGRVWANDTCGQCQDNSLSAIKPNYPYEVCVEPTTKIDYSAYNESNCTKAGRKWDSNMSPSCRRECTDPEKYIDKITDPYDMCVKGELSGLMSNYSKALTQEEKCLSQNNTSATCTNQTGTRQVAQNKIAEYCTTNNLGTFSAVSGCKKS